MELFLFCLKKEKLSGGIKKTVNIPFLFGGLCQGKKIGTDLVKIQSDIRNLKL